MTIVAKERKEYKPGAASMAGAAFAKEIYWGLDYSIPPLSLHLRLPVMPAEMLFSTILITLALLLYSIGVWAERLAGRLKPWHLLFFWSGLVCDTWATGIMMDFAGGLTADIHGLTGVAAILLMLIHAIWATAVLLRRDENMIRNFHKFSVLVWAIWLIPYFSGFILNMSS